MNLSTTYSIQVEIYELEIELQGLRMKRTIISNTVSFNSKFSASDDSPCFG